MPYEKDSDGDDVMVEETVKVTKPNAKPIKLEIKHLFGKAEGDAQLAAAMETVLAELNRQATAQGLF